MVLGIKKIVRIEISKIYPSMIVFESVIKIQTNPRWSPGAFSETPPLEDEAKKLMSPLREG